jgi:hypothetical protein
VSFINVEVSDNEASRLVVNEFPCAHILYSLLGEDRVAGQEFYVCYLVTVSRDLPGAPSLAAFARPGRETYQDVS